MKRGSVLIHDGENSHKILTETLGLTEEVHTTKETRNLSDDDNPMEPINAVHRSLKRFMREHPAYDRDDLQDWLNLFWFIYTNRGIPMDDKVKKLLQMAILTHKVIRFREIFAKKPISKGFIRSPVQTKALTTNIFVSLKPFIYLMFLDIEHTLYFTRTRLW